MRLRFGGDVELDDGERLAFGALRACAAAAAQGEVGDVQLCSPRMVPMRPMTPGTSWLRMMSERAGELGFDVDAVVAEQARRVAVEDGGDAGPVALLGGAAARPVQDQAQGGAGAAGDVLALVFLERGCRAPRRRRRR